MSTKRQKNKRQTKQVRIGVLMHRRLRLAAFAEGITLSKLLDRIVDAHFQSQELS